LARYGGDLAGAAAHLGPFATLEAEHEHGQKPADPGGAEPDHRREPGKAGNGGDQRMSVAAEQQSADGAAEARVQPQRARWRDDREAGGEQARRDERQQQARREPFDRVVQHQTQRPGHHHDRKQRGGDAETLQQDVRGRGARRPADVARHFAGRDVERRIGVIVGRENECEQEAA
jgi:hypothetical protein